MKKYRFRRWIRNWITNFDQDGHEPERPSTLVAVREDGPDIEKSLNFRVWFANGGRVVQTNRYDRQKDRNITSMYVVNNDQDFGREIDKIVSMESLRG